MRRNKFSVAALLGMFLVGCGGGGGGDGTLESNPATPSTPTGLNVQVISANRIDLNWNPATDDVAVLGYHVHQNGLLINTSTTSHTATGLSPATRYCFSVAAFDGDGNVSAQTAAICATTTTAGSAWTTVRSGTPNELSNIVWTGSQLVVVEETFGESTKVHFSQDGLTWSDYPVSSLVFTGAKDLVYGDHQFVAVDDWFFTSPDGISWPLNRTTDPGAVNALAWSPTLSLYVAVGSGGYIGTSKDGVNWDLVDPAPTTAGLQGAAWLNGRFYAVGDNATILTSIDGVDWQRATTPTSSSALASIAWNGQSGIGALYVATGYGVVHISTDGDTWSEINAPPSGFNDSVAWGGGSANRFVVVGRSNYIFSSPDGENWTRQFLDAAPNYAQLNMNEVVWTGTRFVVVGERGTILASDDGLQWDIVASGSDLYALAHDGNRFIAAGGYGRVALSSDLDTWEYRHTGDDSHSVRDLAWNGSRYLAVGHSYMLLSDNLTRWNASWRGATSVDTAVVWDGGRFVKTDGRSIAFWDGISNPDWKLSLNDSANPPNLQDIVWTGSQFVAVGGNGRIYTSPDAIETSTWTSQASGTTNELKAIAYSPGGTLVAVGVAGTILTSDDGGGVDWVLRDANVNGIIYDVTWTGNEFVAVGALGLVLTSNDGSAWNATKHGKNHLYRVVSDATGTIAVGANGTIIRSNP